MQHWDATDKSNHYDAIKFVATFLVVLAHASRMYTGTGVVIPYNASDGLDHLTNIIYSFHMPLYMSVSGMVYALCIHDYQKYQDTARFLKNKAVRLLIPYLFFGIFYVAPVMCLLGFTDQSYLRYCATAGTALFWRTITGIFGISLLCLRCLSCAAQSKLW